MTRNWVSLHTHSEYSMLDGAARLNQLCARAAELGQPALAVTDHGNLYGAVDLARTAAAFDLKAIIGMEAYLAPGSRHDRSKLTLDGRPIDEDNPGEAYTHMTLLAADRTGLANLFALSSLASLEGFYYKPRADRELLAAHAAGIIATTGCPSGEIQRLLQRGLFEAACAAAADYRDIFGDGNFYVEYMDHGTAIERATLTDLRRLQTRLALPAVATNDSHYVHPADAKAHDVLLCVQTGKTLADPKRFKFEGDGYYLKTAQEMRALWDDQVPDACDNTLLIAERCEPVTFAEDRTLMPHFDCPAGHTEDTWLRAETTRGLISRCGTATKVPENYARQAAYELDVICSMGYPGYFLIVADLVDYARSQGIMVGPGRGSVAGSLVAYCLGITQLDPIVHRLIFERFLNPERPSMPDIDLDFDKARRGEMVAYVAAKYGADHVAQIITYDTIKARAAIKDATRALHGTDSFALAQGITKLMPKPLMGKDMPLSGVFDPDHRRYAEGAQLRARCDADPAVREIVNTALGLEGLRRSAGQHAAGVIVSSRPLLGVVPLQRGTEAGSVLTQFDFVTCESLGLLKMDFLGLRNLTILDDCLRSIAAAGKPPVVLTELALDDPATYQMIARGDTLGVFQLDSTGMRELLRAMAPTEFGDISAALALYRPGPMGAKAHTAYARRKTGKEKVTPIHPELGEALEPILGETYGLIVYQEQVLSIAQQLAGYTLGGADVLRRAMGKKKTDVLNKEAQRFEAGMAVRGYSAAAFRCLWDILIPFSDYAFNRAHTAGYGLVSYWTAYLKTHYPAEYMAALLTSTGGDKDRAAVYLAEARRLGLTVLPPDVSTSAADYTAVDDATVRVGLAGIAGVGDAAVADIIAAAPYADFHDFLRRSGKGAATTRTVEALIKAGAFDALGHQRAGLAEVAGEALVNARSRRKATAAGQLDLFGGMLDAIPDLPIPDVAWTKAEQLRHERDMLGLYVTDHPLAGVALAEDDAQISAILDGMADGAEVTISGVLSAPVVKVNAQGQPWASYQLEDTAATIEVVCFARTYSKMPQVGVDAFVRVTGRVSNRNERISVIADEVALLETCAT